MVDVAQVRQLVAEGVHQARVLEGLFRSDMGQADSDRAVGEADAVSPLDVGPLGLEDAITQPKAGADAQSIPLQPRHQLFPGPPVHPSPVPPSDKCRDGGELRQRLRPCPATLPSGG